MCKLCNKTFSKNFSTNKISPSNFAALYLDGLPLRKFKDKYNLSASTSYRICNNFLKRLPLNIDLTVAYSDMSKFSGMLVFDGTYVSVKSFEDKIPLIWAIDYDTHDIPHLMLVPSENYLACRKYFSDLKSIGYDLKYLVCDGNDNIKWAVRDIYPNVIIQTCVKHFLENIRDDLNTKSSNKYADFMLDIESIFTQRLAIWELTWKIMDVYPKYKDDPKTLGWMTHIMDRKKELTNYHLLKGAPNTTNLIEVYNSHLKSRVNRLKGFESYRNAHIWLNGYVLKRRLTNFTDCTKKFKHLNGICSLSKTLKDELKLPGLFKITNTK